jgi:hypothetical protein
MLIFVSKWSLLCFWKNYVFKSSSRLLRERKGDFPMGILALNRLMMGQLPQTEIPSGDADGVLRAVDFLPRKYSRGLFSAQSCIPVWFPCADRGRMPRLVFRRAHDKLHVQSRVKRHNREDH